MKNVIFAIAVAASVVLGQVAVRTNSIWILWAIAAGAVLLVIGVIVGHVRMERCGYKLYTDRLEVYRFGKLVETRPIR